MLESPGDYLECKIEIATTSISDNNRISSGTRFGKGFRPIDNYKTLNQKSQK